MDILVRSRQDVGKILEQSWLIRYDLGLMYYLGKILIRILLWNPWLQRCSKNLARYSQDSQYASKNVNPGFYYNGINHETNAINGATKHMYFKKSGSTRSISFICSICATTQRVTQEQPGKHLDMENGIRSI